MAEYSESICHSCLHSYVCEKFNEHRDSYNQKCHFYNDHFVPAADVAPVRHARWDDSGRYTFPGGGTAVRCTECGCALTVSEYHLNNWNYCPVCGSKMDGDKDA